MSLGLEDLTWIDEVVDDLVGDMVVQQRFTRIFRVDPCGMVAGTYTFHELSFLLTWGCGERGIMMQCDLTRS